jgi:aerobic carbon-monoxide dehydrogenase medium subunit
MLAALGEDTHVYAGGTELLLVLRAGLAQARHLVDVKRVPGMASVWQTNGTVHIGGAVTHVAVAASPELARCAPALLEAEHHVGNVRVRATGTLGGNLCFGEPHGDPGTVLLAHDAGVTLQSVRGTRTVPLDDLLVGVLETTREPDEILTRIELPARSRDGAAYVRFASAERPTAGAAALVDVEDGRLRDVRITVGCVHPRPVRLRAAEQAAGELAVDADERRLEAVGAVAAGELEPVSDQYGPADYKRRLVATLVAQALGRACARAVGRPDPR